MHALWTKQTSLRSDQTAELIDRVYSTGNVEFLFGTQISVDKASRMIGRDAAEMSGRFSGNAAAWESDLKSDISKTLHIGSEFSDSLTVEYGQYWHYGWLEKQPKVFKVGVGYAEGLRIPGAGLMKVGLNDAYARICGLDEKGINLPLLYISNSASDLDSKFPKDVFPPISDGYNASIRNISETMMLRRMGRVAVKIAKQYQKKISSQIDYVNSMK